MRPNDQNQIRAEYSFFIRTVLRNRYVMTHGRGRDFDKFEGLQGRFQQRQLQCYETDCVFNVLPLCGGTVYHKGMCPATLVRL